ncbi:unnamed protein product [Gongylonema pulchrum]|uniref:NPC1_N domain-containing protein n=1 Tax=Gongylonema pulchrum TaxID=637853 RepID=A0A183DG74_9BILA|nr:unnamed protein product [Gongylonema pulchrum]
MRASLLFATCTVTLLKVTLGSYSGGRRNDSFVSNATLVAQCSMRGVCGRRGGMHQTCPYNGRPLGVSAEQHRQTLASLCPHLFQGSLSRECFISWKCCY